MATFIPEGHLIHAGALMTPEEAALYLRAGQYPVIGRLKGQPVSRLVLVVARGQAVLREPLGVPA